MILLILFIRLVPVIRVPLMPIRIRNRNMPPAIQIRNLSKCFTLGRTALPLSNITERAGMMLRDTARKVKALLRPGGPATDNVFWALKDVTFDVNPGEVVGLLGRNGAGKSTLLKVLSRVTVPTSGTIDFRGRLGSLLEVGTGFHPELTGRENIFLSGSILGMRRREILAKYDRIVEFSEIGRHLDTPVKRYSSGQYVRLAFAIAAYLEPEILIVDEVLAVGDATFQRKCIDRMAELARQGRTILFVSHNLQLVPRLCHRAVYLEKGTVQSIGPSAEVTRLYTDKMLLESQTGDLRDKPRSGDGRAKFVRAAVLDSEGRPVSAFVTGTDMVLKLEIESGEAISGVTLSAVVQTLHGTRIISTWTREVDFDVTLHPGVQGYECRVRDVKIRPGQTILLGFWMATGNGTILDGIESASVLDVIGDDEHAHLSTSQDHGVVYCDYGWKALG